MATKAVIFDLEGVLLLPVKGNFVSLLAERLETRLEDVQRVMNTPVNAQWDLGEISDDDFFTFLLSELGQPLEKKTILASFVTDDFSIDSQLLEFVRHLHKAYCTALLTNFPSHLHDFMKTRWAIDGAFDHVIASCDVKLLKPDPRMYRTALEIIGCRPEEAIFVDDREVNIKAAQALGIRSVLYRNREEGIQEVRSLLKSG